MTVTSHLKVHSKLTKKIPPAIFPKDAILVTLSEACALFNMSEELFTQRFIRTRQIKFDRLHRLWLRQVLAVYDSIPKEYCEALKYSNV